VACDHPNRVGDLATGARETDDRRRTARDAGITRVEGQLERFGAGPVGTEDRPQVGEERACVVDAPRL
jgi:hypothetical protein